MLTIAAFAAVFYALAFLRLATSADAALFAIGVAVVAPALRPYLLVLLASIQDAPGLTYMWSYVAFCAVAGMYFMSTVGRHLLLSARAGGAVDTVVGDRARAETYFLTMLGLLVVAYGTAVSFFQASFGGLPQSGERPYPVVGGLMMVMIIAGYLVVRDVVRRTESLSALAFTAVLAIAHALVVAALNVWKGAEYYRSAEKVGQVLEADQLVEAGALGFARINGPFLNANALALAVALLLLVAVASMRPRRTRLRVSALYMAVGMLLSLLTLSKSMAAFFVVTTLVIFRTTANVPGLVGALLMVTPVCGYVIISHIDLVMLAFRYKGTDVGTRGFAWAATVNNFTVQDWIFGTGLSYWQGFFERKVGLTLSDPHSFLLSIPGSFGVVGVLFYLVTFALLVRIVVSPRAYGLKRTMALMILALLFGKDLASIQSVFGNTPLTFMLWVALGLTLALRPEERAWRAARTGTGLPPRPAMVVS